MFFVISGYLMVVIAKRRGDALRPLPYLADRAARIYPLYWLVSAALLAVWIVRPDVVFSSNTDPDILKSFLLWPAPADPLHALGYSLIHFMFFYIVFTLLLAVFRSKRIVIGLAVWCIVLAGVNAALFSIDSLPTRQTPELRILLHPYRTIRPIREDQMDQLTRCQDTRHCSLRIMGEVVLMLGSW